MPSWVRNLRCHTKRLHQVRRIDGIITLGIVPSLLRAQVQHKIEPVEGRIKGSGDYGFLGCDPGASFCKESAMKTSVDE
jgi:hypothetical protein